MKNSIKYYPTTNIHICREHQVWGYVCDDIPVYIYVFYVFIYMHLNIDEELKHMSSNHKHIHR